jgi:hypothetical protein
MKFRTIARIVGGLIAVLVAALAVSACASTTESGDSIKPKSSTEAKANRPKEKPKSSCTTRANDDCTPEVGPNGDVRVDALNWRVTDVETAKTIGDQEYGLGETATGTYVIATLKATSRHDESVDLTSEIVKLDTGGETYDADDDGMIALDGSPKPLVFEQLGPDMTKSFRVVFDVPKSALKDSPKLRFGEVGFGQTHGFIKLGAL